MALINFNTDMGDGWEWSNAEDYPGYIQYTAQAYRMMIQRGRLRPHALIPPPARFGPRRAASPKETGGRRQEKPERLKPEG